MAQDRNEKFRSLHRDGCFVMPNPHDVGTAKLLVAMGFPALATTSSGFASTIGRLDMTVDRDTVIAHVADIVRVVDVPVNVDSERCYAEDLDGIKETVRMLAETGAAGFSIEDWNPVTQAIDPFEVAVERVGAAREVAEESGLVLTARCEHRLHGINDLDETIGRLTAYRDAGADVVYAPGLASLTEISRVVTETGIPVNALLLPGGPTVGELADAGIRRISTGGTFASLAFGAVAAAAQSLLSAGSVDPSLPRLERDLAARAFG
jgi:2-methylisocitrate lyase-like PEP mutase family enzyme